MDSQSKFLSELLSDQLAFITSPKTSLANYWGGIAPLPPSLYGPVPCHAVQYTRVCLTLRGIRLPPWLSKSPGINVIEKVWLFFKRKLQSNPPKTKEE